ncbi:Na+/H+ antiporter NhaC [Apilactobacillus xinyiensis]|uniref:Na+/H+ antiporter NhaC n=1 Tax=Apilactobacillus xinyiensis TaxID=2841032 RepID=A0ABT0I2G0_9LACO|nr:Na+/H+ antiporter NhaC [Apilactobacillus xinyiensis]MCK8624909.1 Na+/H+ antiporter NhaC [Apilactobacillus xinyiensis]MCL0312627.1 Na+/H+ antiporter NhaC [Apilactobacillus xinyiensis]MCL0319022.1 Na+/H+ antiporter NhaC [Apilactobacillus xinyiensis]MCL0330256.1 Na+/H+ antiporter NhaC [Apilactobacillus xinyiensis]
MENSKPKVSLLEGIIILLAMIVVMGVGVIGLGISPEVPILIGIMMMVFWGKFKGFSWDEIDNSFVVGIQKGIVPLFIFLLIGSLIGVWIAGGIIPSLMVFGFHLISAEWFLPSVFIVCALVGSTIGSAFTVISTLGIAFMGIGITMGISPAMIAGAVLSGAIFGDKSSPLSASTNLASAVVGADLIKHIKNLMWSTIPAMVGSFILFAIINRGSGAANFSKVTATVNVLESHFNITFWAIIPIVLLFACAWAHIPTIPTLFINVVVSSVMIFIQNPKFGLVNLNNVITSGFVSHTGNKEVDTLLSRGGISSMMGTIVLIMAALAFGGLLMNLGVIDAVMNPLTKRLNSDGKLITTVIATCIGVNVFVGEQFLSVILPGNAFKNAFKKANLAPVALSRALEDGGTVINYLVPWGVAGAFITTTLSVPTSQYAPFVFLSILSPIFSILSGFTGIAVKHLK